MACQPSTIRSSKGIDTFIQRQIHTLYFKHHTWRISSLVGFKTSAKLSRIARSSRPMSPLESVSEEKWTSLVLFSRHTRTVFSMLVLFELTRWFSQSDNPHAIQTHAGFITWCACANIWSKRPTPGAEVIVNFPYKPHPQNVPGGVGHTSDTRITQQYVFIP